MLLNNIKIGSDIEWFVKSIEDNEIISAEGLIKGSKENPFRFDKNNEYFSTQLDNVLAEGNIPPSDTFDQFYRDISKLRTYIESVLPTSVCTDAISSARLDPKWLITDHAKMAGCAPYINCWTKEQLGAMYGDNLRAAAIHIHVGYDNPSEELNLKLGQATDLFVGVPSILIDKDRERRFSGYGLSGSIRHQKHGMEWRVLGSYFTSSKSLLQWVYEGVQRSIKYVNDLEESLEPWGMLIQNTINYHDYDMAKQLCSEYKISY